MTNFSLPESGLVIESFSDPESLTVPKNELEICVYRGIPYADAERFRESVVREKIPSELPIIKGMLTPLGYLNNYMSTKIKMAN